MLTNPPGYGILRKKEGIHTKISLTSAQLRLLALALMLLDHMGRVLFPGQLWMICLGRLAFPIFAFRLRKDTGTPGISEGIVCGWRYLP